jgi:hypothetical protein
MPSASNSTLLILMLREKEGSGTRARMAEAISKMKRERFSRQPPYLSVRLLVLGERN